MIGKEERTAKVLQREKITVESRRYLKKNSIVTSEFAERGYPHCRILLVALIAGVIIGLHWSPLGGSILVEFKY